MAGGVRPSPGAAGSNDSACGDCSHASSVLDIAAPEDGRAPPSVAGVPRRIRQVGQLSSSQADRGVAQAGHRSGLTLVIAYRRTLGGAVPVGLDGLSIVWQAAAPVDNWTTRRSNPCGPARRE